MSVPTDNRFFDEGYIWLCEIFRLGRSILIQMTKGRGEPSVGQEQINRKNRKK